MPQIIKVCKKTCYTTDQQDVLVEEGHKDASSLVAIPGQRVAGSRVDRYENHEDFFEEVKSDPAPRVHPDIQGQSVPSAPIMSRTSVVASETEQPEQPTGEQPDPKSLITVDRAPEPEKQQTAKGNKRK